MVGKKLARGISLMMVGQLTGNVIGLTSTLVMAALLIPEDFGVFALATSFVTVISAMFDLQTSSVLIQMPDPKKQDFDTVFTLNLLRGLILCLGVCALAWPIAASIGDERLFPLLLLLSLQPLLLALRNPYFERFAKDMSFAPTTFVDLIAKVLSFVGSVGYAIIYPSYWALACGVLLSATAGTIATFVVSRELPGLSLASFRKIFSFSIWLGFSGLMNQLRSVSDRIILGIGMNAVTLGFYALALQIVVQIMTSMMKPFNWAMFSGFSQFNQEKQRLRDAYRKSHAAMGAIMLPSAAGLFLISEPLILTFFGTKWENSILFIQFGAAAYFVTGIAGPFWALGMALGETQGPVLAIHSGIGCHRRAATARNCLFRCDGLFDWRLARSGRQLAHLHAPDPTTHRNFLRSADHAYRPTLCCKPRDGTRNHDFAIIDARHHTNLGLARSASARRRRHVRRGSVRALANGRISRRAGTHRYQHPQ